MATPGGGEVSFLDDGTRVCAGLVVSSLRIADRDIALASTAVDGECLLSTKEYGPVQMRSEGPSWEVWLTADQKARLLPE